MLVFSSLKIQRLLQEPDILSTSNRYMPWHKPSPIQKDVARKLPFSGLVGTTTLATDCAPCSTRETNFRFGSRPHREQAPDLYTREQPLRVVNFYFSTILGIRVVKMWEWRKCGLYRSEFYNRHATQAVCHTFIYKCSSVLLSCNRLLFTSSIAIK